jgi:hypothetical protein
MTAVVLSTTARGADHADGTPTMLFLGTDTSSDITDIFAWMSPDSMKMKLVMDVAPGAATGTKFSNVVKYVFHTSSHAAFGMPPASTVDIICSFDSAATQNISCWVVKGGMVLDYVTGDASNTAGIMSVNAKVKVFAGLRDDPFFFNLAGFKKATQAAAAAAGGLTFNAQGCPTLNAATAGTLVTLLGKDCTGTGNPQDFFAPTGSNTGCSTTAGEPVNHALTGNVLAIALLVDKTLLNQGGNIVSVWGATTH